MALENDCPAQRTAKLRCCAAVLTTMSALEPSSALRKATLSNPSMPEVDAMRCAPGHRGIGERRLPQRRRRLRSEEHTSELQSPYDLVCRLLLEKKKK